MFKKKPFFIVFEGVEGCGKSYQSKKLKQNLEKKGIKSILTREPGGTKSAESIRSLILKDYFNKTKSNRHCFRNIRCNQICTNHWIQNNYISPVR